MIGYDWGSKILKVPIKNRLELLELVSKENNKLVYSFLLSIKTILMV